MELIMSKRQRILTWTVGACLVAFAALAASPSFNQFITSQFATSSNQVRIKIGASVTNLAVSSSAGVALNVSDTVNFGTIASFSDSSANSVLTITPTALTLGNSVNLTMSPQTASTVAWIDASKHLVSVANGTGSLTNDGAGVLGWYNFLAANVSSISIPMGAWFVNNVGDGASITNAVALSVTNSADGWSFLDAQTNAIRTRFALPADWDGSSVKWALRVTCTAANTQPNTNVVFAVRGSMIGMGDREDSPTWSTLQWVTNGLSPTAYIQTLCITKAITPGGTVNPTNSILWEIQRLGGQTGDTATVATVALLEAQIYYSRTNRQVFPTSSP